MGGTTLSHALLCELDTRAHAHAHTQCRKTYTPSAWAQTQRHFALKELSRVLALFVNSYEYCYMTLTIMAHSF